MKETRKRCRYEGDPMKRDINDSKNNILMRIHSEELCDKRGPTYFCPFCMEAFDKNSITQSRHMKVVHEVNNEFLAQYIKDIWIKSLEVDEEGWYSCGQYYALLRKKRLDQNRRDITGRKEVLSMDTNYLILPVEFRTQNYNGIKSFDLISMNKYKDEARRLKNSNKIHLVPLRIKDDNRRYTTLAVLPSQRKTTSSLLPPLSDLTVIDIEDEMSQGMNEEIPIIVNEKDHDEFDLQEKNMYDELLSYYFNCEELQKESEATRRKEEKKEEKKEMIATCTTYANRIASSRINIDRCCNEIR